MAGHPMQNVRWRRGRLLVVAALVLAVGLDAAQAQTSAPNCPADELALQVESAGYARHGEGVAVTMVTPGSEAFSNVTGTMDSDEGSATTPLTVDPTSVETTAILTAPSHGTGFVLTVQWDQDAGTQRACHGTTVLTVPLVPPTATVGRPSVPRLQGRYRVSYRPINYSERSKPSVWRLTPNCEFFACSTQVRSTGGLRGRFRLRGRAYRLTAHQGRTNDSCTVTRITRDALTGEVLSRRTRTIPNAFKQRRTVRLRVTREADGLIVAFSGETTAHAIPTPAARRRGCRRTFRYKDRIVGRRL